MNHFSLFTGDGGVDLAAEWAGYETVGMCEIDEYCRKVLDKHWPDVPKWRDVRDVTNESVRQRGIGKITVLSGGPPCQPFSIAGKRRGKADDRDLWPEMLRVIREVRPRWVIGENVAGFVSMGLDQCISDLEGEGYEVQTFIIPACAVNAPHRRDRVWIVANNGREREERLSENDKNTQSRSIRGTEFSGGDWDASDTKTTECEQSGRAWTGWEGLRNGGELIADTEATGLQIGSRGSGDETELSRSKRCHWENSGPRSDAEIFRKTGGNGNGSYGHHWAEPWIEAATRLCRVDDGLPRRMDRVNRLKALGNSIVPQVVAEIILAILNIETSSN